MLKAVPAQVGDGWRVFIQWANARIQYISGFESFQDAEKWIASEAQNWLNALNTQLSPPVKRPNLVASRRISP